MQPTAHLKFIGGKLHQWHEHFPIIMVMDDGKNLGQWLLVESE